MCSNQNISPTADHRHPRLAEAAVRSINAIEHAASVDSLSVSELSNQVIEALHGTDSGEHVNVVLGALPRSAVDGWNLEVSPDLPTSVKSLLASDYSHEYLEPLCAAIVRLEACHHVSLVKKFVSQFVSKSDPESLNRTPPELYAYGYVGLSNALRGYDPASSNTLSTFAAIRIVGAVRDGIRAESPVPKRLTTFVRAVESAEEKLTLALSRVPTREELSAELGEQARYLHLYPRLRRQASLDELEFFNPPSTEDVNHQVEVMNMSADLHAGLVTLDPLERNSFTLLYGSGLTERAAAKELGITQRELKGAASSAIAKLRDMPSISQWESLVA